MSVSKLTLLAVFFAASGGCSGTKAPVSPPAPTTPTSEAAPAELDVATSEPEIDWQAYDSTSLGNPNDGALRGGVPLPLHAPGIRFNPERDPRARHGTVEVVRALVQSGARVDRELGGLPVTINDLSYERGGPLPRHRSHQSGRDVDVFFYQLGPDGKPIESVGAFFDPQGNGVDFRDLADPSDDVPLTLDIPRTWLFLQALIEDERAQLQHIYVAEHLRALLLEYANARDVPPTTRARFEDMTCQPAYPHDDHFHFRFFCTPDDIERGCRDSAPMYPWHLKKLKEAGVTPRPLIRARPEARAKIVTHEEARKAAGPMDAEVERWLDRRTHWIEKPHPGRPYCP
ncbi:MAG TPA: penicillin-insensitive murein endopeptidase [Polyangiales bacterium]|nr:penicillin-insensitive murein endopeptidase [Polyangiales bacterium]